MAHSGMRMDENTTIHTRRARSSLARPSAAIETVTRSVSEGRIYVFPGEGPSLTLRVTTPENFARKTKLCAFAMQSRQVANDAQPALAGPGAASVRPSGLENRMPDCPPGRCRGGESEERVRSAHGNHGPDRLCRICGIPGLFFGPSAPHSAVERSLTSKQIFVRQRLGT